MMPWGAYPWKCPERGQSAEVGEESITRVSRGGPGRVRWAGGQVGE